MIYTIGHSTRSLEEFIELLKEYEIGQLVDVRTIPRSRRNPQFNQETLAQALTGQGIGYIHLPELGGLRKPRPDSVNSAWRNDSFRGFADYMGTPDFVVGLEKLIHSASESILAIMCAEAVPWRCHRSLIGDALSVRGFEVIDIIGHGKSQPHRLTPFAKVKGVSLVYLEPTEGEEDHQEF